MLSQRHWQKGLSIESGKIEDNEVLLESSITEIVASVRYHNDRSVVSWTYEGTKQAKGLLYLSPIFLLSEVLLSIRVRRFPHSDLSQFCLPLVNRLAR